MAQSKELTAFYQSYQDWLDRGAPNARLYYRAFGLCASALIFMGGADHGALWDELRDQFHEAGLSVTYPFGEDEYDYDAHCAEQHLNTKRLQWVKDHLNG